MSRLKSCNQERASFALKWVREFKGGNRNKYKTYAQKLPALITTNGLVSTLAFLKSKNEARPVYETINEWLRRKGYEKEEKDVLGFLVNCDFSTLRLATMEALSFANWLKRIVEIEIEEEK